MSISIQVLKGDTYHAKAGFLTWLRSVSLLIPAFLFLLGFFIFPLLWTVGLSFKTFDIGLANYTKLLTDSYYLRVTVTTLVLSAIVSFICLVVGYPIAYYLVRYAKRSSGLIIFLLITPLLTSIIMRAYGWRIIFAKRGLLNIFLDWADIIEQPLKFLDNPFSVVTGLVHVLIPFMVLAIAVSLRSVNRNLEESALIMGASKISTFFLITLPLTFDGIATGTILVFMLANGSFVTILLLGGGSLTTLPLLIFQQFNTTRDFPFAAAMSNVLLVLTLVCLYFQLKLIRRKGVS